MKKILILIAVFFISSCSKYRELNSLSVIIEMGINKDINGYTIYLKEVNKENNGINDYQYFYYVKRGKNIADAITKLKKENNNLYFDKMQSIIINDQSMLTEIIDYFPKNKNSKVYYSQNIKEIIRYDKKFNYLYNLSDNTNTLLYWKKHHVINTYNLIWKNKKISKKGITLN